MVNFLKDVSLDTFIGELPSIINFNNNSLKREFEIFYDSSEGRLSKSLYAPTGSVQSHWGRFTNLEAEYVKFSNRDSLSQALENAKLEHNIFVKKFRNDFIDSSSSAETGEVTTYDTFNNDFCHDPAVIASGISNNSNIVSLEDRLRAIESSLGINYNATPTTLANYAYNKELTPEEEYIQVLSSNPDYYFYTEDFLAPEVYNSTALVNPDDINELQIVFPDEADKGNQLFNYYSAEGKLYLKVDNSKPIFIYGNPKNYILNLIFENTSDEPFYIVLTREGMYEFYRIENSDGDYGDASLVKLQLIRVNANRWNEGPDGHHFPSDNKWSIKMSDLNIYNYKKEVE